MNITEYDIFNSPVDYRAFHLTGSHYEIGVSLGQLSQRYVLPPWWPEAPPLPFAQACAHEIALIHPPLLDEIHGYADSQQVPYGDMLRMLCRQKMTGRTPTRDMNPVSSGPLIPETGGCISFAWRVSDGQIIVGRNYDFHTIQRIRHRITLNPSDGYNTVGMRGSVPGGRYDGVNSEGLLVCLHVVMANRPEHDRAGIPFHFIPRLLLETCSNVDEALYAITLIPHMHSFNYLLADSQRFVVVEAHADRLRILENESFIAVGNCYQHPQMKPLSGKRTQSLSHSRIAYLHSLPHQQGEPWALVEAALRHHDSQMCGHQGGHTTLWSMMAHMHNRVLQYAPGAPCSTPFEEVSWPLWPEITATSTS